MDTRAFWNHSTYVPGTHNKKRSCTILWHTWGIQLITVSTLHVRRKASVSLRKLSDLFEVRNRVKQGCLLVPTLCLIFFEWSDTFTDFTQEVWIYRRLGQTCSMPVNIYICWTSIADLLVNLSRLGVPIFTLIQEVVVTYVSHTVECTHQTMEIYIYIYIYIYTHIHTHTHTDTHTHRNCIAMKAWITPSLPVILAFSTKSHIHIPKILTIKQMLLKISPRFIVFTDSHYKSLR